MTKRDYQIVAHVIRQSRKSLIVQRIAYDLATEFQKENPLFDRETFLLACGLSREVRSKG